MAAESTFLLKITESICTFHWENIISEKVTIRKNKSGYYGIEGGVYALFRILGLQFNYNFDKNSKYNFGLYIKYW
ncbi:MAG: hypothetical protein IPG09_18540 [Ignavibacteria bacterium]|nr:hypothetical protein [Ignavibacteria bacterium]